MSPRRGYPGTAGPNSHRGGSGIRGREGAAGWLFVSPVIVILSLFLVIPVIVAIWVSVSDWSGKGSPLTADYVGLDNYQALLTKPGLAQRDLATHFGTTCTTSSWWCRCRPSWRWCSPSS